MRRAAALAAALLALAAPAPARADAVSGAQLRALAQRAAGDPAALVQLRAVDRVDGRPVDVAGALRGARGAALRARLDALARPPAGAPPRDASRDARDVLAQRRFHANGVPGPFRGLFRRLERLLPDPGRIDRLLPGGRSIVWLLLAALVALTAAVASRSLLSRRVRVATAAARAALPARDDPRALERRAAAAEAEGELELALRLRFRAGLLRLDERGAITFRASISTHEVRHALRSGDFDALAATFDEVVYGGRAAQDADVAAARERWPEVVARS